MAHEWRTRKDCIQALGLESGAAVKVSSWSLTEFLDQEANVGRAAILFE